MKKRILSMIVAVVTLLSVWSFGPVAQAATWTTTEEGYKVYNYAKNAVGTFEMPRTGLCQAFVRICLEESIGMRNSRGGCCAMKAGQTNIISTSRDDIPLGAAVYFAGSRVTCSQCGQKAGHVGIYIGNNEIAHSWGSNKVITKSTIDYVINCGYTYCGWGWQGGYALATSSDEFAATIQPGLYALAPACAPDRQLDVQDGATASGTNVQIWRSNDTAAQQWNIESLGGGYYRLVSRESGKVLDVADAKKTSGTNVQQCIWTDNPAQRWRFTDAGDGYYHISPQLNTDLRLDVNEKEDANGTNVQLWEANDSSAQKWKLVPVSYPAETDHAHQKGTFLFNEAQHPHYGYYQCSLCGVNFTDGSTVTMSKCSICNPAKATVGAPSQPAVSVDGQSVAVSWDYTGTGEKFDVYLVQAPWGWEDIKYHGTTTNRSYTFTNVAPGGYAAFVIARPNTNQVQSGWTDLSVAQPAADQQPAALSAANNSAAQRFVDFAVSQVGKRRADYGYNTSWCGYFVGWCSEQLGMESVLPPKKNSANGVAAYQYIINRGGNGVRFYDDRSDMQTGTYLTDRNAYTPQIGDIVIFSWGTRAPAGHLYIDHVGIVQKVENGRIYVVHGNYHSGKVSGGIVCGPGCSTCGGASWPLSSGEIYAYARPNWASISAENVVTPPSQTEPQQPSVTEYFDCDVYIYTTAGQAVNAYANIFDAKRKNWFDLGQTLYSRKGAKGSDGSTWYQVQAVNARDELVTLWVNAGSPGLTIEEIEPEPNCDNGHTWGAWTTTRAATCMETGQRERACTVCGTTQAEPIDRLEHDYRLDRETDTTLLYVCANCGASYTVYQEPAPAEKGNMGNFTVGERYSEGMFRDVKQGDWFESNVAAVYELGLMRGTGSGTFSPGNNVTLAEAVTLAARLHSIYYTGEASFPGYDGGNWYDPYVDYAKENGLISTNYLYTKPATREEFVHILARALPEEALEHVTGRAAFADDGDIVYISDVELLQRAGIINGIPENDQIYFKPAAAITRAEVAAIVGRMAQPATRVGW